MDSPLGILKITTFKKEPIRVPRMKMKIIVSVFSMVGLPEFNKINVILVNTN